VDEDRDTGPIERVGPEEGDEELPVVARMVVEIRSDGSRTIARGAVEDRLGGQSVGVEARADSPLELSRALAKMLLSAPFAASSALLTGGRASPRDPSERELEGEGRAASEGGRLRRAAGRARNELRARLVRGVVRRISGDED
jgi:hypothetical protein